MKEISHQPKKQKEEFDPIACMKEFLPNVKFTKHYDYTNAILTHKNRNTIVAYFSNSNKCVGFVPRLSINPILNTKPCEYGIMPTKHDGSFIWSIDYEEISIRYPDAIKARMKKLARQIKESFVELAKKEMEEDF